MIMILMMPTTMIMILMIDDDDYDVEEKEVDADDIVFIMMLRSWERKSNAYQYRFERESIKMQCNVIPKFQFISIYRTPLDQWYPTESSKPHDPSAYNRLQATGRVACVHWAAITNTDGLITEQNKAAYSLIFTFAYDDRRV